MADILDKADEASEAFFRAALTAKKPTGPSPNGACHACGTHLAEGKRFCDEACRDDFEYEQRRAGC
jgi:hypothetical protein